MPAIAKICVFALTTLACVFIYAALKGPQGLPALRQQWSEIRKLQKSNAELTAEVNAKSDRIRRLRDSQQEQEREIRGRLKLQKPNETTFIVPEEPADVAPAPLTPAPPPDNPAGPAPRGPHTVVAPGQGTLPEPATKSKPASKPRQKKEPVGSIEPSELLPAPALALPVEPVTAPNLIVLNPVLPGQNQ